MKLKLNLCQIIILFSLMYCTAQQEHDIKLKLPNRITVGDTLVNLRKSLNIKPSDKLIPYFYSSEDDYKDVLAAVTDDKGVVIHDGEYKPTFIFQSGMNAYRYYKKYQDQLAKEYFEDQVTWLVENFHDFNGKYGFWFFTHEKPFYSLEESWPSALSQGMGIGLALMAYHETRDPQLINILELALKAYAVPVKNGGFLREWDGGIWFEEYPTASPSRVLNGFVFSIAGLYNLYVNTGNELALKLFEEGIKTLSKKLPLYDAEFVSNYSLYDIEGFEGFAKKNYHKLHIWQLLWLYDITHDDTYYKMAKKFLEIQKTKFNLDDYSIKRVKEVTANTIIGNNVAENAYDNQWAWGGVWASNRKDPRIKFDLYEPHAFYGVCIYFNNEQSQELPFTIFVRNGNKVNEAANIKLIKRVKHISNKNRSTFINVYHFDRTEGEALIIKFFITDKKHPVAITEVDVFLDMEKEIEMVYKDVQRRRNVDQKFS